MQLSVRLDYRATNNEIEYEALIADLQAAQYVGAVKVLIHSDSQLAAQELSRTFEISNAQLSLYAEAFEKMKTNFQKVIVQKIPRSENQTVDELEFQRSGVEPVDPEEAHLLKKRVGRFTLIGDQLYKRVFTRPLLKCVGSEDIEYILKEVHQGSCGGHPGGRALARKILLAGYFWPTLQEDVARTVATCLSCQKYHNLSHRSTKEMKASTNIICRFDILRQLVSHNGRQFTGWRLREWCEGYSIQQAFTLVVYPQGNGQTEVTNREILRVLCTRLDHMGGSWVDELLGELWALRTTPKEAIGITPFQLMYGSQAVVPVEVGVESDQVQLYDEGNLERRLMELDLVDETRAKAVVRLTMYQ
ncbi:uncharacterized protein LOC122001428 [Zingiber officinale]|uniref:uncharacterized protein LOC122001428 n=1 Tax=Zingiber officinale TaxID=94328 RepID=UPI001C4CB7CB|nr:uncharacterized protein LOC122001428 [Zingiber officinale]